MRSSWRSRAVTLEREKRGALAREVTGSLLADDDVTGATRAVLWVAPVRSMLGVKPTSCGLEAIEVHDLGPSGHEVAHEGGLVVIAGVDLGDGAQLRV